MKEGNSSISIAGAGPAGLSAAITLARRGFDVVVYDQGSQCGERFLGDFQAIDNFSFRDDFLAEWESLGFQGCSVLQPVHSVEGFLGQGPSYSLHTVRESPLLYLTQRGTMEGSLDQTLYLRAIQEGVKFQFGSKLAISAADIIATGPSRDRIKGVCKGIVFETDFEEGVKVLLGNRFALNGYSYLVVRDGRGCIFSVPMGDFDRLDEQLQKTLQWFQGKFGLSMENACTVYGHGSFRPKLQWRQDGIPVAGEATGLMDPLFGFGIRYAILSGIMAADAITVSEAAGHASQLFFSKRMRRGILNRFLWELGGRYCHRLFLRSAQHRDCSQFLHSVFQPRWWSELLFPLVNHFQERRSSLKKMDRPTAVENFHESN